MKKRLSLFAAISFVSILIPFSLIFAQATQLPLDSNDVINVTAPAPTTVATTPKGFVPCTSAAGNDGTACNLCTGVTLIQNVIDGAIFIAFLVALALFAWAGALFMTSGANPSGIAKAKSIFTDVAIGFALVLCGFIVVDTIIHTVIINSGDGAGYFSTTGGNWYSVGSCTGTRIIDQSISKWLFGGFSSGVAGTPTTQVGTCSAGTFSNGSCNNGGAYSLASGYSCIAGSTYDSTTGQCGECDVGGCTQTPPTVAGGVAGGSGVTSGARGVRQCDPNNTACNVQTLQQNGLTAAQANVMSCIAYTESAGNSSITPGTATDLVSGQKTSACGTFQFIQSTWSSLSSKLPSSCQSFSSCTNPSCNISAAVVSVQASGYSAWAANDPRTGSPFNPAAVQCVNNYGSSAATS